MKRNLLNAGGTAARSEQVIQNGSREAAELGHKTVLSLDANSAKHWCKRAGPNRVCLSCGRNVKYDPGSCPSPEHHAAYAKKQAYCKSYFQQHKQRLIHANAVYRSSHPRCRLYQQEYCRDWYARNREKKQAQNRAWEEQHSDERRIYLRRKAREWHRNHLERSRENCRRYYQEHKAGKNRRRNAQLKAQRRRDPGARVRFNLRVRLSMLIRKAGGKMYSISKGVLLYSANQLRAHIERQFTAEMTWANYGKYWEVDHVKSCSQFDLTSLAQARECFGLPNLRPLEIIKNRSRSRTHITNRGSNA